MVGIFLAFVFDAPVVNDKEEGDGACAMASEAWRMLNGTVAMRREFCNELLVGEEASLREAVHALLDIHVDAAVVHKWA